jgi:glycine oxidase
VSGTVDVLVIGAGAVGLAVALRLLEDGHRVTVVERERPGAGASTVAAGILSPTDEVEWEGELGALNRRAMATWPTYADALEDVAGVPAGLRLCGSLRVDVGDDESAAWLAATRAAMTRLDLPSEQLGEDDARALVPALGSLRGALHAPTDGAVDTERFVAALVRGLDALGGELHPGEVVGLRRSGDRVHGVDLADGGTLAAGVTVVAAGPWSGVAEWLPPPHRPAVSPVAGEAVLADGADGLLDLVVRTRRGSMAPRDGGRLWIGTSVRRDGFVTRPKLGEVAGLLARASAVVPAVADLELADVRVGLRPTSADGSPHVGDGGLPGLLLATGHGREGILHAPIAADAVAGWVAEGRAPAWAEALTPRLSG